MDMGAVRQYTCCFCGKISNPDNFNGFGSDGRKVFCYECYEKKLYTPTPAKLVLKSVEDHNRDKRHAREDAEEKRKKTGVACPNCTPEMELLWDNPLFYNMSRAAKGMAPVFTSPAECPRCLSRFELEV